MGAFPLALFVVGRFAVHLGESRSVAPSGRIRRAGVLNGCGSRGSGKQFARTTTKQVSVPQDERLHSALLVVRGFGSHLGNSRWPWALLTARSDGAITSTRGVPYFANRKSLPVAQYERIER